MDNRSPHISERILRPAQTFAKMPGEVAHNLRELRTFMTHLLHLVMMQKQSSDDKQLDQWLIANCRLLTGKLVQEVIQPWNASLATASREYAELITRLNENCEAERNRVAKSVEILQQTTVRAKQNDLSKLKEVRAHFGALNDWHFESALNRRLGDLKSGSPYGGALSGNRSGPGGAIGIEGSLDAAVSEAHKAATRAQAVQLDQWSSGLDLLKRHGAFLFIGLWIAIWIVSSMAAGFYIALSGVLVYVVGSAIRADSNARKATAILVDAIARKHDWMDRGRLEIAKHSAGAEIKAATDTRDRLTRQALQDYEKSVSHLISEKTKIALEINERIKHLYTKGHFLTASFADRKEAWKHWSPPQHHAGAIRLGTLVFRVDRLPPQFRTRFDSSVLDAGFALPILASLVNGRSIYCRVNDAVGAKAATEFAQGAVLRILASAPPAKVLFTFIDPIGQGQNVAEFLKLGDFGESLVNTKAWTDPRQIERKLTELTEHMETVIQKYLRSDFRTIDDYNAAAGEIAEAYRVIVVFDYPDSITETAGKQLERIVLNGGRCGVFAIIVHDASRKAPYGVDVRNIRGHALEFAWEGQDVAWNNYGFGRLDRYLQTQLDGQAPVDVANNIILEIGEQAKTALRVAVPYHKLLQLAGISAEPIWERSTAEGISIPLGPGNARKPRYLELGVGLSVHALVVGRPGSGKSNLMHVVITTALRMYSPDELQLYLIDFKEGVEFKPYAEASPPGIQVVAVRSEREFGLSVLRALDGVLKERAEIFRNAGVSNIADYRRKEAERAGQAKMPRILLVVDEFQEFFVQQDRIADEVSLLLDRIVRQGRAFGIHLLLGSQTLAGYTLPRATLNLITVRIALQSGEADSRMIFADDNTAPRLLTRPGEGIYNATSGLVEGNNLFQVALFEDEDRRSVFSAVREHVAVLKLRNGFNADWARPTLVFEGHEPASIERSLPLAVAASAPAFVEVGRVIEVWLGEPIEIKPAASFKLARRGGSHLLVVDRNEEQAMGLMVAALVSILTQAVPGIFHIPILDLTTADAPWAEVPERFEELFGDFGVRVVDRRGFGREIEQLYALVQGRVSSLAKPQSVHFLILLGMHRARDLRQDDTHRSMSFGSNDVPGMNEQFAAILRDGPECGVHVLGWCDSYGNLDKIVEHRLLAEFGTRVVGQMSASDSSRLIEEDGASKLDRPYRVIKYDEERVGALEIFRPYAVPPRSWVADVAEKLHGRMRRTGGEKT